MRPRPSSASGRAYEQVCTLLEERRGLPVVRLRVDRLSREEVAERVVEATEERVRRAQTADRASTGGIDVVATTMSGSIQDQAKVGRIGPEFRARTSSGSASTAQSHAEAEAITRDVVQRGGRLIVSAGGAGTFNAVLEGAHLHGGIPGRPSARVPPEGLGRPDRQGARDPGRAPGAVRAIVAGIESGATVDAGRPRARGDHADGRPQTRHLVGFGGFGVFGDVPRFTESRFIKLYKGLLGRSSATSARSSPASRSPPSTGRSSASAAAGPGLTLVLDGEELPPETWVSVIVLNGDLGRDFKLAAASTSRAGPSASSPCATWARETVRQALACKTAAVLDDPARTGRSSAPCAY